MAQLHLTLFGGFDARLEPGGPVVLPRKKAQALVAYLALRPGSRQPRDKLIALLWGDCGDDEARHNLRQTIMVLRRSLGSTATPLLLAEGETLAVNAAAASVDVPRFESLVLDGNPEALRRASELYLGDLLEGLTVKEAAFEEWLRAERARLREQARAGLTRLLDHEATTGDGEQAIQTAVRLLAFDPLQESVHRTLIRLHAR